MKITQTFRLVRKVQAPRETIAGGQASDLAFYNRGVHPCPLLDETSPVT